MKLLAIFCILAANMIGAPDTDATRRIFDRFSEADRLVVRRGALCHPNRVKSRTLEEVKGNVEVREVLSHLVIEERAPPQRGIDEDTGEEVYFRGMVLFICPDYTLFFFRGGNELGTIGLVGISVVKAQGEKEDRVLAETSRAFLNKRFGLIEEPDEQERKKG